MRWGGFVVCCICDFACAVRLAVRLQVHYLHFHYLFNAGNQLPPNTNKGYLKSSRDATRYYTNISQTQPWGVLAVFKLSPNAQISK
jgi:hypothetical protein